MPYQTTGYPLDTPAPLWEALTIVQANDRTVNDEVVVAIARHVDDVADEDDLDAEQQAAVRAVLDE